MIGSLVLWTISIPEVQGLVTLPRHPLQGTALSFARKQCRASRRLHAGPGREDEIRRKIAQLRRQGKIKNQQPAEPGARTPVAEQYASKVRNKLGAKKAQLLGQTVSVEGPEDVEEEEDDDDLMAEMDLEDETSTRSSGRQAQLGALPREINEEEEANKPSYIRPLGSSSTSQKQYKNYDASLFEDDDDEGEEEELSEQDLLELVAAKMQQKQLQAQREKESKATDDARQRIAQLTRESQEFTQGQQLTGGRQPQELVAAGTRVTKPLLRRTTNQAKVARGVCSSDPKTFLERSEEANESGLDILQTT